MILFLNLKDVKIELPFKNDLQLIQIYEYIESENIRLIKLTQKSRNHLD